MWQRGAEMEDMLMYGRRERVLRGAIAVSRQGQDKGGLHQEHREVDIGASERGRFCCVKLHACMGVCVQGSVSRPREESNQSQTGSSACCAKLTKYKCTRQRKKNRAGRSRTQREMWPFLSLLSNILFPSNVVGRQGSSRMCGPRGRMHLLLCSI